MPAEGQKKTKRKEKRSLKNRLQRLFFCIRGRNLKNGRTKDVGASNSGGRTRPEKPHLQTLFRNRRNRCDFDDVEIVATEKLESSRRYMDGYHTKIINDAINRAVIISGCYFVVPGIGERS